jgi:hypothetical protein|nr:MAG TPA: portal protein [Caudoviricetes sp.]
MNENEKKPTKIWEQYTNGLNYLTSKGLIKIWQDCENFYEGNQWPAPTNRTKSLPRPIFNISAMIADNKKAGILSGNVKMIYKPAELYGYQLEKAEQGAEVFTKFAESLVKEVKEEDLDDIAIGYTTQLGTAFYHYYWDVTISGGLYASYVGAMRAEVIHPRNVIVSNPTEKDIQKQKYIIIVSSEPLGSVKELAKKNGVKDYENIKPDNELPESEQGLEQVTVLTKYSRQNGKVVWEKSTKEYYLQKPTLWQPEKEKVTFEDEQEINEPDNHTNYTYTRKQLYPVSVITHKERKRCIYGIGEIEQAIQNNKALNFNVAMMLLSVQDTSWPKIIQKVGALANQSITNEPGQILTDTSKTNGWGVKYLETPSFNAQALTLTNTILDITRTTSGSTEVVTGEVLGANMAASAIIALQNQAKKPIEMYQKKFYRCYSQKAKIYEQFFKYYYSDSRLFGFEQDNNVYAVQMNGSEYENFDFNVSVEVGSGGVWSESLAISLLDSLKADGTIDADDYIELYPDTIMSFKEKLKKIRQRKKEEAMQQQMMIAQIQNDIGAQQNIGL